MTNIVVLRSSPDWLIFDFSNARNFLQFRGYSADLIDRFITYWDRASRVDFRTFRHQLKYIARQSLEATGALLLQETQIDNISDDDNVIFIDDDDWLSPRIFDQIDFTQNFDGQRWGSVRIGLDYDPTSPHSEILHKRPLSNIVYTNNYLVKGHVIRTLGKNALFEHSHAQTAFDQSSFIVEDSSLYLSATLKHPCSITTMCHLLENKMFIAEPAKVIVSYVEELKNSMPCEALKWMLPYLAQLNHLFSECYHE